MLDKMNTILEVRNLTNHYSGKPLLQDVSFCLIKGEILCLLGPSGSGKTTLLRLIAGLENGESGTILYHGKDIRPTPPHKRKIGMMFQEYALFPHKTVWQNIAFGLEMQNVSGQDQDAKINDMLALVGLLGFGDRKISELSGGERQRVALARSLAPEPDLLLLDEPLGSLDRTLRDRLTIEIRAILKTLGVTAIFVTHDQAEAFSVADKVAILRNGKLQQFATPETIYRSPANRSVAGFLGFTNFIKGKIDGNGYFISDIDGLASIEKNYAGNDSNQFTIGDATLLLRPDGAQIPPPGTDVKSGYCVTGKVVHSRFQGASYRLTIYVQGQTLIFDLPIDPRPPLEGENILLQLHPLSLVILEP